MTGNISGCYRVFHDRKDFVSYDLAEKKCKQSGKLAVPKTEVEYKFIRHLVSSTIGYTGYYCMFIKIIKNGNYCNTYII